MKSIVRLLAFCGGLLIATGAGAQTAAHYPDHPVRLLVGFAAGGPTDVIARIVAQKLSVALGQQFYVDDKPGAGGNIANAEVAKATPDGYTLAVVSTGFMVNMSLYAKVPYDAVKDFAPITMVAYSPNVIVVNPSVPAKSVKELIALIKANPSKYSFAGPGIGSTPHFRVNCSSRNSASTSCTCRSPAPRRRSIRPLPGIRRSPSPPCRRRWAISRPENCAG